jgi:hypothetical protein
VATLTAATSIAAAPESKAAAASPEIRVSDAAVSLAAASSILNIPINLLIDLANVPSNEVAAINYEAAALFYTGSWWVSDATNIWGTDPGDPPKYIGGAMIGLPFPYLSIPLGTVLASIAIAELPVNSTCGPVTCPPVAPFDFAGVFRALVGLDAFPLINNFFTVPLSALFTGYYLDPTAPGQQSYVGPVPTNPFGPEYPLPGTVEDPNNPGHYLMPWAGQTINLNDYLT